MEIIINYQYWIYATWLSFVVRYRKTLIGPLWMLVGPVFFICLIGILYTQISASDYQTFIPHLTIGLIVWTLISGFVLNSTTIFQRYRAQVLQGELGLIDIVMVSVFTTILQFLHQVIIIFIVLAIFNYAMGWNIFICLLGIALIIINGIWISIVFGVIGARYHDLAEIITALIRIAFLATPIIWAPDSFGRGGVMGPYLNFNPFYHFIEIVRAPLMGNTISVFTWAVVLIITALGSLLAWFFMTRFNRYIALWV